MRAPEVGVPERMVLMVGAIGGPVLALVGVVLVLVGVHPPEVVGLIGTMVVVTVLSLAGLVMGADDA